MKKRFIPATVAALALSFSAVAVPQAVAVDSSPVAGETAETAFQADVTLTSDETQRMTYGDLARAIDRDDVSGIEFFNDLADVTFSVDWLDYDFENGTRNLIAEGAPEGNHTVAVTFTYTDDSQRQSVTDTLNVTIDNDEAPVITPIAKQVWERGTEIAPITLEATDETVVSFAVEDLPNGVVFSEETGQISGTPTALTEGTATITATDEVGNSSTLTIDYEVVEDATAPVIEEIADQNWFVGSAITPITVEVDEEDATVDVDGLPTGVEFNKEAGVISGTPTAEAAEAVTVTVSAIDAAGNAAEQVTFTFTVVVDETAPVITEISNQAWTAGETITPVEVEVNEEYDYTVKVEGLPEGVAYNAESGEITGTPTEANAEAEAVTVNATDAAGNAAEQVTFTFTVAPEEANGSSLGSADGSSIDGSSEDGVNWGLVGLGGVLAAVIGVIAAIGGGFIQLPPALANLIPFL